MWSSEGRKSPAGRQTEVVCGAGTICARLWAKTDELRQQIKLRLMDFLSTAEQPQTLSEMFTAEISACLSSAFGSRLQNLSYN